MESGNTKKKDKSTERSQNEMQKPEAYNEKKQQQKNRQLKCPLWSFIHDRHKYASDLQTQCDPDAFPLDVPGCPNSPFLFDYSPEYYLTATTWRNATQSIGQLME